MVVELLATTKNYVDADNAEKLIKEDMGGTLRPDHPPRHDDNCNKFHIGCCLISP
jgi:hypothetical protein